MAIQRWDPFGEVLSLRGAMDRLFEDAWIRAPGAGGQQGNSLQMPLDVYEQGDKFQVMASLPGVKPEDVKVTVQGNTLTIEGELRDESEGRGTAHHREHRHGHFFRSVTLPTQLNAEGAKADFEHGVLTLNLPKVETARSRQIPVGGQKPSIEAQAGQKPELAQITGKSTTATADQPGSAKATNGKQMAKA
ncbi:MAG: Hsp20/alpha crystallin family protein [Dehalococcoidia bacterium]